MRSGSPRFAPTSPTGPWIRWSGGRWGIRVNGMGPDLTQTPQVDLFPGFEGLDDGYESWAPVGRIGWPEDQARVALFLASDRLLAAHTSRITFATSVMVTPQRQTALVAKQAAAVDVLSGGRLRLGIGIGWRRRGSGASTSTSRP